MNWYKFVEESNRIEGILRPPTDKEVSMTEAFVCQSRDPTVESLSALALLFTGGRGKLRDCLGRDVRVGNHVAPKGGTQIREQLETLLLDLDDTDPFEFHVAYESLHPFMDGNGRTGRALWARQMYHFHHPDELALGFLHAFYYQSLAASRAIARGRPEINEPR